MSEATVYCHHADCRTDYGPRRWLWLCNECAEECAEKHRRESGHDEVELRITYEPTMDNLRRSTSQADVMMRRRRR